MRPLPRLLETYEEARLLLEAKGWGIAKAAEHLSELPEMARFHISQTKVSKKRFRGASPPSSPKSPPPWRAWRRGSGTSGRRTSSPGGFWP